MFIAAQITGFFVTIVSVFSMQFKKMAHLVAAQMIANLLLMLNYLLLGGFSGAGVAIIATVQSIVVTILNTKKIKVPAFITIGFMLIFFICSIFTYKGILDITVMIAAQLFALAIVQEKSSVCRKLSLGNSFLWVIYDIGTGAYTTILTHGLLIVSTFIAIIRHDIKKEEH